MRGRSAAPRRSYTDGIHERIKKVAGRVLLIAHRGASAHAPENSMEAFGAAVRLGADAIETDVRLTADGVPVLAHDDDLTRTTGVGARVSATTLEELRARTGDRVPTLRALLDLAPGVRLFLELKARFDEDGFHSAAPTVASIAPLVAGRAHVTISSFDPMAVAAARRGLPGATTALGAPQGVDPSHTLTQAVEEGHPEIHVPAGAADAGLVARARTLGRRVLVFTVNAPEEVRAMAALGVDGIFTDDPAEARAALAS